PGASYIVSNMSSIRRLSSASILPTGFETSRSRLSGSLMMSRSAMAGGCKGKAENGQRSGNASGFRGLRRGRAHSGRARGPHRVRTARMSSTLFIVGGIPVGVAEALSALGLAVLIVLAIVLARAFRRQGGDSERHAQRAADLEARLSEMVRVQADTAGRVHM